MPLDNNTKEGLFIYSSSIGKKIFKEGAISDIINARTNDFGENCLEVSFTFIEAAKEHSDDFSLFLDDIDSVFTEVKLSSDLNDSQKSFIMDVVMDKCEKFSDSQTAEYKDEVLNTFTDIEKHFEKTDKALYLYWEA